MVSSIDEEIIADVDRGSSRTRTNHSSVEPLGSMSSVDSFNSIDYEQGDLLVGFPNRTVASSTTSSQKVVVDARSGAASSSMPPWGEAKQRNSVSLNPMAVRKALAGFIDSDGDDEDDDDDDDAKPVKKESKVPRNPGACGGPEHRPLVGGFAAAAYEAARVDFYQKKGVEHVRGHRQPSYHLRNP